MAGPKPGTKVIVAGRNLGKKRDYSHTVTGLPISVDYMRYDEVQEGPDDFLASGMYIVSFRVHKAGKVALDAAQWDDDGRITFHSSKHGYLISLKDYERAKRAGSLAETGMES